MSEKSLTRSEIADAVQARLGLPRRMIEDVVNDLFGLIRETLARGEDVKVSGFGAFQVRRMESRPGRNPRTGQTIPIPAQTVVRFKLGEGLRKALRGRS
jgi:integration host factor subunit alpha